MTELFNHGYGLFVGIGGDDIPGTVNDAEALYSLFLDPNAAAYPQSQVQLMIEDAATREGVLAGFDKLISQTQKDPDAVAIVYYSGHGGRFERDSNTSEYFLVPHGYDPAKRSETSISGLEFTQKIESINANKLIVLLDCCHAGGIPALKEPGSKFLKSPVPPELIDLLDVGTGKVVIASSKENEYSLAGRPYSVFTACLLDALHGQASLEKDGFARILDILIYLFKEVPKKSNGVQHPLLKKALDLGDNFPLCYYLGGGKGVDTRGEQSNLDLARSTSKLTLNQRERLQLELPGLKEEYSIRLERIGRLRKALSIEDEVLRAYKYEQNLLQDEQTLASLRLKIEKLEDDLKS